MKKIQSLEEQGLSIINKKRYIVVNKDDIVTYKDYEEPVSPESSFYLFDENRRKELSDYMKENNYKLKSGTYCIGDSQSFEEILKVLEFEKVN